MRRVVGLVVGSLLVAACSGSEAVPAPVTREVTPIPTTSTTLPPPTTAEPGDPLPTTTEPPPPLDYAIEWNALGDRVDEGRLTVPLDYADPQGDTIDLYVTRHRANPDERIGVLLVNNGGPGAAASEMGVNATSWFRPELTDRFDVVAWDPRGTGVTDGAVDCIEGDEYDRLFAAPDITPEDDAERAELVDLAQEFARRCVEQVGRPLEYVGTNNSARDMDAIRQALGEPQVSFFGFSYGSELGAVWATLFPTTVRAAVFDGAADPDADALESTRQQWVGFEAALDTFLARCSDDDDCRFHNDGDAEGAFDQLLRRLDDDPLPGPEGRPDVNLGVAVIGVVRAMYSDQFWPALERALAEAQDGNGSGLLALHDAYYQRRADGSYSNLLEAFQAITCADDPDRPTVEESDEDAEQLIGVAPRLFPYTTGSYSCTFFPDAVDPRVDITGIGAGPIVVVGTTGDPTTPLDSSRQMAASLEDGRLVVVEANQHTGYRVNGCIDDVIHEYLVQLDAPDDETVCS